VSAPLAQTAKHVVGRLDAAFFDLAVAESQDLEQSEAFPAPAVARYVWTTALASPFW